MIRKVPEFEKFKNPKISRIRKIADSKNSETEKSGKWKWNSPGIFGIHIYMWLDGVYEKAKRIWRIISEYSMT